MNKTSLKISIVIPAYNEESHLGACLDAVAKLVVKPYEVIVVNNLSTDSTVDIAKQYPFVTLVDETGRGVVFARDCGYQLARGDIIGRIDADTIVTPDWTKKIEEIFEDSSVQAVSGKIHFYDIGLAAIVDGVDAYFRAWMAKRMEPNSRIFLLGSNMAIRKSAWNIVEQNVCRKRGLHEDLDLALHLSKAKLKVVFDPGLVASLSARRVDASLIEFIKYAYSSPKTYFKHNAREHIYMYPIVFLAIVFSLVLRLLFRAYDTHSNQLSFKTLFIRPSEARINPTEF